MSTWRRLSLQLPEELLEEVTAVLHDAGCLGAEWRDGLLDAWFDEKAGFDPEAIASRIDAVLGPRGAAVRLRASESTPDGRWHERWMEGLQPFEVAGRFLIVPGPDVLRPASGLEVLRLTPGRAFGTGEHVTTRMCLEYLASEMRPADSLLDVGTGSGILAIAARRLTSGQIAALDTDPSSLEVAQENAVLNVTPGIWWVAGSLDALAPRPFDLVVANVAGATIGRLMPGLSCRARRGIFLAGILDEEEQELRQCLDRAGMRLAAIARAQGWIGMAAAPAAP